MIIILTYQITFCYWLELDHFQLDDFFVSERVQSYSAITVTGATMYYKKVVLRRISSS